MPTVEELIAELTQLDVHFYCHHAAEYGGRDVVLSPRDLLAYRRDPTGFLAGHYGVSKADYLGWHQSNYSVICAGRTQAGKACKNFVEGGNAVGPKEWAVLQGNYCHLHR